MPPENHNYTVRVLGANVTQEFEMLNLSHEESPLLETDHPGLNLDCFKIGIIEDSNNVSGDPKNVTLEVDKSNTPWSVKLIVPPLPYGFVDI